jgi:HEAT repeat protein
LERLGDQRAIGPLRDLVVEAPAAVQAHAAVALAKVGDPETVELARYWMSGNNGHAQHKAAAQILALARAPGWVDAVRSLLDDPSTHDDGLKLAAQAPHRKLVSSLAKALERSTSPDRTRLVLTALARAGSPQAMSILARTLKDKDLGPAAAYALALSPVAGATQILARALGETATSAIAARASVVRMKVMGHAVPSLEPTLKRLLASTDGGARAAGAWGFAVVEPSTLPGLLKSDDPIVVCSAARALLTAHADARAVAAQRLSVEQSTRMRTALALGLIFDDMADGVPTAILAELVDGGGAEAPLALYRLVARRDALAQEYSAELRDSPDPLWRAHLVLGWGLLDDPSVVGKLDNAYATEAEPAVRHAIVTALGLHTARTPSGTLSQAMALDPDEDVRRAARWAKLGHWLRGSLHPGVADSSAWIQVRPTVPTWQGRSVIQLTASSAMALPFVPDPDGLVVIVGLPVGPIRIQIVATDPSPSAAPSPG